MARTAPKVPADEVALSAVLLDRFLSNVGSDLILVGGQALAFWMRRFRIPLDDLQVSTDADVLGDVESARAIATALKARLEVPPASARTALVAQVRLPVADQKVANLDVLHQLFTVSGLRKSMEFTQRVVANAVTVEWRPGVAIRIMDPFDLLESRIHNASGLLHDKGPHVLTQASWAIEVAKVALVRLAEHESDLNGRVGKKIQRVYALASSQPGRQLWREHRIDVLDAVVIEDIMPLAPECEPQLRNVDAARQRRRAELEQDR